MSDPNGIDGDLWHVELGPGEVHVITLGQLDDAFARGLVNESTRVWQAGMEQALPLGELLGAGEEAEPPPPPPSRGPHVETAAWPNVDLAPPSSLPPPSVSATYHASAVPSVMPTALDLSGDFESLARPRRSGMVLAVAAILAVAGGAFAFLNGTSDAPAAPPAAGPPPPVVEAPKSHAYDPGSEPIHLREVAPTPEITKGDAPPASAHAVPPKASGHGSSKAKPAPPHRSPAGGKGRVAGFKGTKSGSKYDPLNGSL